MEMKDMLKQLRKEKNLTQEELARELNISKSAISMYENGNRKPDYETLEIIADFFNVDMEYLWGKTDIRKRESIKHTVESKDDKEQQLINTISNYLYENSKVTLGEIKRGKKVDVLSSDKVVATYDVELVLKAYEIKPIKEKFSLKDIEDLADRFAIPEDLKGITRKQYIKFMGESAMFFDDASISDETKEKILLSFQKVFYDAKERNKRKKEDK